MCTELKVLWLYVRHLVAEVAKFCTVVPYIFSIIVVDHPSHPFTHMCAYQFIFIEQEKPYNSKADLSFQQCGCLGWNLSHVTHVEPRNQRQLIHSWKICWPLECIILHLLYLPVFFFVRWNDRVHGKTSEAFYIWIEDPESNYMYHSELFIMTRKQVSALSFPHYVKNLHWKVVGKISKCAFCPHSFLHSNECNYTSCVTRVWIVKLFGGI